MGTWKHKITERDQDNKTGVCLACGPVSLYYHAGNTRGICPVAKQEQRGDWKKHKRGTHGLTLTETSARLQERGGVCEICGGNKRMCIDHDHITGNLRGILCGNCNAGIGMLRDNPALLRAGADYIERWKHVPWPEDARLDLR